jgi:hypothetical protein
MWKFYQQQYFLGGAMGISQPIPGGDAPPEPVPASTCTTSSTQAESGGACVSDRRY